ncbi:MAG: hypothetical protein ACM3JJ_07610 [Hyphomicrobiales bacterium]
MSEPIANPLRAWDTFYLIVGGAAGALTGLQFVVLTLISESGVLRGGVGALAAFGSPNVVHFCAALLVSAICGAPWAGLTLPGGAIAVAGVCGVLYSLVVMRRAVRQSDYEPVLEDWAWHAVLPTLAYASWIYGGFQLERGHADAPYYVGGAALLLLFVGIHNAWDTVVYVMVDRSRRAGSREAVLRPEDQRTPEAGQGKGGRGSAQSEEGADADAGIP